MSNTNVECLLLKRFYYLYRISGSDSCTQAIHICSVKVVSYDDNVGVKVDHMLTNFVMVDEMEHLGIQSTTAQARLYVRWQVAQLLVRVVIV